jgi:streptomycin 6-kinase
MRRRAALQHYVGRGCVRVLDSEAALDALLIARAEPGESLWVWGSGADAQAAAIMRQL